MKKNIKFVVVGLIIVFILLLSVICAKQRDENISGGEMDALRYETGKIININYEEEKIIVSLDANSEYYDTMKVELDYSVAADKDKMKKIQSGSKIKFGFFLNSRYKIYLIDAGELY